MKFEQFFWYQYQKRSKTAQYSVIFVAGDVQRAIWVSGRYYRLIIAQKQAYGIYLLWLQIIFMKMKSILRYDKVILGAMWKPVCWDSTTFYIVHSSVIPIVTPIFFS